MVLGAQQALDQHNVGIKKHLVHWAESQGMEKSERLQYGGTGMGPIAHPLAHKLVLAKFAAALGLDHAKLLISSAAPISAEVSNTPARLKALCSNTVTSPSVANDIVSLCHPSP